MAFTVQQKLEISLRDGNRCHGVPELGIKCGRKITKTSECRFDARIGDWLKLNDQEKHPTKDGRILCLACDAIKTARDQKLSAKDKRLRGETKTGPKAKIANRGFSKTHRKKMNGDVVRR